MCPIWIDPDSGDVVDAGGRHKPRVPNRPRPMEESNMDYEALQKKVRDAQERTAASKKVREARQALQAAQAVEEIAHRKWTEARDRRRVAEYRLDQVRGLEA